MRAGFSGWLLRRLTYANVVATLALVVALGGTSAMAAIIVSSNSEVARDTISGHKPPTGDHPNIIAGSVNKTDLATGSVTNGKLATDSVGSDKVIDGSLTAADLAAGSVDGSKVIDGSLTGGDIQANSLTGTQINAATLGEVPLATIGGLGVAGGRQYCNPEGSAIDCSIATINLPTPARLLIMGGVTAQSEDGSAYSGNCYLVTNSGYVDYTLQQYEGSGTQIDGSGLVGMTGVFPAGSHDIAVECGDNNGHFAAYVNAVAVAISPH